MKWYVWFDFQVVNTNGIDPENLPREQLTNFTFLTFGVTFFLQFCPYRSWTVFTSENFKF